MTQSGRRKGLEAISQVVDFAAAKFNEKLDVYGRILGKKKYTGVMSSLWWISSVFRIHRSCSRLVMGNSSRVVRV